MVSIDEKEFQEHLDRNKVSASSVYQRSNGDTIEREISRYLENKGFRVISSKSVRSIEDFSVDDVFYDVKTRDLSKKFSMPNLISYDRLKRKIIELDQRLVYIFVNYRVNDDLFVIDKINFVDYFELNVDVLSWANLGTGQLQILGGKLNKGHSLTKEISKKEFVKSIYAKYNIFCVNLMNKTLERLPDCVLSEEVENIEDLINKLKSKVIKWQSQVETKQ